MGGAALLDAADEWLRAANSSAAVNDDDEVGDAAAALPAGLAAEPLLRFEKGRSAWAEAKAMVASDWPVTGADGQPRTARLSSTQCAALYLIADWVERVVVARADGLGMGDAGYPEPLRLVVTGAAGSGKTLLFLRSREFVARFLGEDSVDFRAFTNAAAVAGGGGTVHASGKIAVAKRGRGRARRGVAGAQRAELEMLWEGRHLVWIDECSMLSNTLFSQFSRRVGEATHVADRSIGGLGAVLSGDFLQGSCC